MTELATETSGAQCSMARQVPVATLTSGSSTGGATTTASRAQTATTR